MTDSSSSRERELLELQCRLARLKIRAAQQQRSIRTTVYPALTKLADSTSNVLSDRRLLRIALLPAKWRYRLPLLFLMLVWSYWSQNRHRN